VLANNSIWGLLGPSRIFSLGKVYGGLLCFFPIGFILPILVWLVYRKYPQSWLRYVNIPVLFAGSGNMPPATVLNFGAFGVVAWIFNYQIKRKQTRWWIKYNYVRECNLAAAEADHLDPLLRPRPRLVPVHHLPRSRIRLEWCKDA
jgi:hypothetical protein